MKNFLQGLLICVIWMIAGAFVSIMLYERLFVTMMVGNYSPPAIWLLFRDFGLTILPILLVFGGLPASVQIWRGRPYRTAFLISLSACLMSTALVVFVVFYGPEIFGWWW